MSKCGELQGAMKVDRKTEYVIMFLLDPVQSQSTLCLQQLLHHSPDKAARASFCSNLIFSGFVSGPSKILCCSRTKSRDYDKSFSPIFLGASASQYDHEIQE